MKTKTFPGRGILLGVLFCLWAEGVSAQSVHTQDNIFLIQYLIDSLSLGRVSDSHSLASVIDRESLKQGMDPLLIVSVISVESSFRSRVVSDKGAVGLMQLLPSTGREIAQDLRWKGSSRSDLFDSHKNVKLGISYLKKLKKRFGGNTYHMLSAYYIGEKKVKKLLKERPHELTYGYARKVMRVYRSLQKSKTTWVHNTEALRWD